MIIRSIRVIPSNFSLVNVKVEPMLIKYTNMTKKFEIFISRVTLYNLKYIIEQFAFEIKNF